MPKNRIIVTLGLIIALLPILGFPRLWESFFQVVAGLSIILLSIWTTIDKRLSLKAKAQKRQIHRRREAEIEAQRETLKQQAIQEEIS
ncbi:MAG: hypothetical protein A2544_02245 [Candidatus Zambryskibacteria bacterium RIFOXYD2_FULL_43_10]|uniref:Uncharacterized protein n=1 Tax=Candidatus Zambryskibacteria bacterium RIFOXYD2_FULL_43_10 TaxID=1802782 RepID=A0A1G2V6Z5_9BACT|nr:MAG: hypothetical protein A2544_02245 [Candidatus Zambryskibacteria bacterium RIFOXYD2_FULL_43_10]HAU66010.1 hypothetical protein [Candidatus Uhrbacteria bacterium]